MKYILTGEMVWKDAVTGEEVHARTGDLIWLPVGSRTIIAWSKGVSTIYVEQRHRSWEIGNIGTESHKSKLKERRAELVKWYTDKNPKSAAQVQLAAAILPGGNTRTVLHQEPFPLVLESGKGTTVTSLDGQTYTDFVSEYSAAFYGHSHPAIHDAVQEALSKGSNLGGVNTKEAELGFLIQKRFPSMELLRFTNSGTEANTMATAAALAYTKRDKVSTIKLEGINSGILTVHTGSCFPERISWNHPHVWR